MSDHNFLKEFGKNLDRERLHEAAEADWAKLAASLDAQAHDKRRRHRMLAWAFPLAALMGFALLSTLMWQMRSQAHAMQAEIVRLRAASTAKPSISQTDTVVRHISVIRYDTIYRTVVLRTLLPSAAAENISDRPNMDPGTGSVFQEKPNLSLASGNPEKTGSHADLSQNPLSTTPPAAESAAPSQAVALQKTAAQQPAAWAENHAIVLSNSPAGQEAEPKTPVSATDPHPSQSPDGAHREVQENLPLKIVGPPQSHLKQRPPNAADFAVTFPPFAPSPVPMIRRFRPHNAMVGITGGMLFSQTEGVEYHNNYSLGLMGQLAFGRHLRLMAGAEHSSANFKAHGSGLPDFRVPPPTPPTPNDDLKVVELRQPIWDFSLGLRYVFTPEKHLRPYVSAGWLGQFVQEQTLRYEFLNKLTEAETYVIVPRNNDYFNANGLQLGLGVEWAFTKQLSLGLEGLYRRQASTLVPLLVERWGLKAGLGYRF